MENEIKNAIPVTITQKQMKYFDINLIKHDVLDVYPDSPTHNTPGTRLPLHTSVLGTACWAPVPAPTLSTSLPLRGSGSQTLQPNTLSAS